MTVQISDLDVDLGVTKKPSVIQYFPLTTSVLPESSQTFNQILKELLISFLQRRFYSTIQEPKTQTVEEQFDFRDSYYLHTIVDNILQFEKNVAPKDLENEAQLDIAGEFAKINEVKSIYVQKYRAELHVHILLAITHYDRKLMKKLLNMEYDLRKRYPAIIFNFSYPPVGASDHKAFIHPQALCICSK